MLSRKEFDDKMLEWCRKQSDYSLLDVRTYAWIISNEGKDIPQRYIEQFIKKYLVPI